MEIRVLDFELITRNYLNYQKGVEEIDNERKRFIKRLDPLKSEMESIIKLSSSGLIVDPGTQQARSERFQKLQEEAVEIDSEFNHVMKKMRGDLNITTYDELSVIVDEWAKSVGVDLVTGKMEVIYSNPKYDATNDIIDILREKDLFVEYTEKESV